VMLKNGTRHDINQLEYGMREQIADSAYFTSAVATSANIRLLKNNIMFLMIQEFTIQIRNSIFKILTTTNALNRLAPLFSSFLKLYST